MAGGAWAGVALLGCGVLLPYNCLLQVQSYFDRHAFPGLDFTLTSMLCYSAPLCIAQTVLIRKANLYSVNARMWASNIGMTVVNGVLIVCTALTHTFKEAKGEMYAIVLITIICLAATSALMQTGLMGLAGTMGPAMSVAAMFGFGVSGIVSFGLALLLDLALSGSDSELGPMLKAAGLFAFCTFYGILSTWVYHGWLSRRVPAAVQALTSLEQMRNVQLTTPNGSCTPESAVQLTDLQSFREEGSDTPGRPSGTAAAPDDTQRCEPSLVPVAEGRKVRPQVRVVLRQILPQALNVWLVFAVTMSIFPQVMNKWVPGKTSAFHNNDDLLSRLLTGAFQVFDLAGRYLAELTALRLRPGRLWIQVVLRLLFVPAFMLGQRDPGGFGLWADDWGRFLLVSAMALTNGFAGSCAMMFGPGLCQEEGRETAGIAMSTIMVTGIFCGSMLAFLTQL